MSRPPFVFHAPAQDYDFYIQGAADQQRSVLLLDWAARPAPPTHPSIHPGASQHATTLSRLARCSPAGNVI